jgi:2-polyprenyl-3-methyl-5-hydroxy-6-metoxy-1,4-benzoquinol methylase
MNPEKFYQQTAERNTKNTEVVIPQPINFVGKWGSRSRIQITHEMLAPHAPYQKLLDMGCGGLDNLINLEKLFDKGYGIDITSYPSWEILSNRFELQKQNLDDSNFPYESNTFDVVTILMVLEHVFDPFTVIEEISRVTKQNGYLVINVPNIAYIKYRMGLLLGELPVTSNPNCWEMREWDGGHIHYFTLEKLTWLLQKFGNYKVLDVQSSGKFAPIKHLIPSLLCSDLQMLCQKM